MSIRNILRLSGSVIRQQNINVSSMNTKIIKIVEYVSPKSRFLCFRKQFRSFQQDGRVTDLRSISPASISTPKLILYRTHQSGSMSKIYWAPAQSLIRKSRNAIRRDGRHRIWRNLRSCRTLSHEPKTLWYPFSSKLLIAALADALSWRILRETFGNWKRSWRNLSNASRENHATVELTRWTAR